MGYPTYEILPREDMVVDHRYQRDPDWARIGIMADQWDERLCEPLTISRRADGTCAVVEGQHRYEAAGIRGVEELPSIVHEGLTAKEESSLFGRLNNLRKKLDPYSDYKAALFRGEVWATTMKRVAESYGYVIAPAENADGTAIVAIGAAKRVTVNMGESVFADVCSLLVPWQGLDNGRMGHIIEGLGHFLVRWNGIHDDDHLRARMASVGPSWINVKAMDKLKQTAGGGTSSRPVAVCAAFEDAYNMRRPAGLRKLVWEKELLRRREAAKAARAKAREAAKKAEARAKAKVAA